MQPGYICAQYSKAIQESTLEHGRGDSEGVSLRKRQVIMTLHCLARSLDIFSTSHYCFHCTENARQRFPRSCITIGKSSQTVQRPRWYIYFCSKSHNPVNTNTIIHQGFLHFEGVPTSPFRLGRNQLVCFQFFHKF